MADATSAQHHQLDPVFKHILEHEMAVQTDNVQTEMEVSRLPRTIDAMVLLNSEEKRQKFHEETPFFYALQSNQIEFKGRRDPLTINEYHLIEARTKLYLAEYNVAQEAMTVTILCAGKPKKVMAWAQTFRPFRSIAEGYYKNENMPPVYLIVINELPIVPKNYFVLLFASSERKFRKFLKQVLAEGGMAYVRYAYKIRPKITREMLTMSGISTVLSREDLEFIAEDIGPELLALLPPEERLAGISPEERLAGISVEERVKGLTPEERKKLLELLLKMQNGNGKTAGVSNPS